MDGSKTDWRKGIFPDDNNQSEIPVKKKGKNHFVAVNPIRPEIKREEDVKRLADKIQSSPTTVVNILIELGIELFEKSINELPKEFKKQYGKKFNKMFK